MLPINTSAQDFLSLQKSLDSLRTVFQTFETIIRPDISLALTLSGLVIKDFVSPHAGIHSLKMNSIVSEKKSVVYVLHKDF